MTALAYLTTTATVDERRTALLELADQVDSEDRHPGSAPFSPVLDLIVPPLCAFTVARDVVAAMNLFGELVGAVAERDRFLGHEDDWLNEHELPCTDWQREATFARLQSDVDLWADRLLGRAS